MTTTPDYAGMLERIYSSDHPLHGMDRLRLFAESVSDEPLSVEDAAEAIDAIDKLADALRTLLESNAALERELAVARTCEDCMGDALKLVSRVESAEAERDEAREYGKQARLRENAAEDARVSAVDRASRAEAERDSANDAWRKMKDRAHSAEAERDRLAERVAELEQLIDTYSHDGRLQTFEDRERFRAAARSLMNGGGDE